MTARLAKSSHVVLAEAAANFRRFGGPPHAARRFEQLADVARRDGRQFVRLGNALLDAIREEPDFPAPAPDATKAGARTERAPAQP